MEFLSEIRWLPLILDYFLKSTLILSLALLLAFLMQKRTAAVRHLILSLFFIGLLFLPILSTVNQGWETKLLPAWQRSSDMELSISLQQFPQHTNLTAMESDTMAPHSSQAFIEDVTVVGSNDLFSLSKRTDTLSHLIPLLWSAGLIFLLFRLSLGLYGAFCLTRGGEDIKESIWRRLLYRFLSAVSLKRSVNLLSHGKVQVPLTWGVFKPVIMMPAESETWTEDQRSSALFHELSHVKRADFLVMLLARLSLALFWFNPLSWVVFRKIKKEQEKACDELVLKTGIKPSTYAAHLLAFRRSLPFHWNPPTAVLGAMGRSQLDDRLTTILKQKLNLKEINMKAKIMLGILVILSISFIGMARSAAPAIDASIVDIPLQEVQAQTPTQAQDPTPVQAQEQEQEKKTKKAEEKEKQAQKEKKEKNEFVWTTKTSEESNVQITVVEKDGKKKSFTITAPTIIYTKEGKDKKINILTGSHLDVKKDEKGNYVILRSGKVDVDEAHLDEAKNVIKIEDGAVVTITTKDKDGDKIIELDAPEIYIHRVHVAPDVHVERVHVDPDVHVEVVHEDPEIHIETVHVDPEVKVAVDVAVPEHQHVRVKPYTHAIRVSDTNKKQIKKIEEILEKANEGTIDQEEALKEIEEVVAKINEKLESASDEYEHADVYVHTAPRAYSIRRSAKAHAEGKADVWVADEKEGSVIATIHDDGTVTIVFHDKFDSEHKEKLLQAVRKLEEDLPEGYKLKVKIHDSSDVFSITVTGVEDDKDRPSVVKKIIDTFKKELEKIKE